MRAVGGAAVRGSVVVLARAPSLAPGAAQTAAEVGAGARQLYPTFTNLVKVGFTRRCGRAHGPSALGWRAAVRGAPRLPLREAQRVEGARNGLACEASPAALGATHSVECVPAAARGVPPLAATPAPPVRQIRGRANPPASPHGCER